MLALDLTLVAFALVGHAALWITFSNQVQATAMPGWLVTALSWLARLSFLVAPAAFLAWSWHHLPSAAGGSPGTAAGESWRLAAGNWGGGGAVLPPAMRFYLHFSAAIGVFVVVRWAYLSRRRHASGLLDSSFEVVDVAQRVGRPPIGRGLRSWLAHVPGNEVFHLEVNRKELAVLDLPPALDGLSIAHLSDLHYYHAVDRSFFDEVVRITNRLEPELVAITGDLVDGADCIEWIGPTLGQLVAPYGVYAILGNHDLHTHRVREIREAVAAAGLEDMGGRWLIRTMRDWPVIVAGNELPWLPPAADVEHCPCQVAGRRPLRLLLAHSPDQFAWARRFGFQVMLAGHTHGGQIQVPIVGPIVAPSRHGVRFASGTFFEPPTVMHVSRGVSAVDPIRLRCRPELTQIVLRAAQAR